MTKRIAEFKFVNSFRYLITAIALFTQVVSSPGLACIHGWKDVQGIGYSHQRAQGFERVELLSGRLAPDATAVKLFIVSNAVGIRDIKLFDLSLRENEDISDKLDRIKSIGMDHKKRGDTGPPPKGGFGPEIILKVAGRDVALSFYGENGGDEIFTKIANDLNLDKNHENHMNNALWQAHTLGFKVLAVKINTAKDTHKLAKIAISIHDRKNLGTKPNYVLAVVMNKALEYNISSSYESVFSMEDVSATEFNSLIEFFAVQTNTLLLKRANFNYTDYSGVPPKYLEKIPVIGTKLSDLSIVWNGIMRRLTYLGDFKVFQKNYDRGNTSAGSKEQGLMFYHNPLERAPLSGSKN